MGGRIVAVIIVLLLMLPASLSCVSPTAMGDGEGNGDVGDPKMIVSGEADPLVMAAGGSTTAYIGVNWSSFVSPLVKIETWMSESRGGPEPTDPAKMIPLIERSVLVQEERQYPNGVRPSAAHVSGESGFNGVYSLTLSTSGAVEPAFYKFKVTLTETIASVSVSQSCYYAIHMKAVSGVNVLVDADESSHSYQNYLRIERDTPYQAVVMVGGASASAGTGDDRDLVYSGSDVHDSDGYYFYAEGLPEGVNMKLDGIIEGKPSRILMRTVTEGTAILFAVSKNDASQTFSGALHYYLAPGDSFEYEVGAGGNKISCFEDGFVSIDRSQPLEIRISEVDGSDFAKERYSASITMSGASERDITGLIGVTSDAPKLGTLVLNDGSIGFEDGDGSYTGIMQLHITKTLMEGGEAKHVYRSILHILVAGPVAHSGLSPAITSA